MSTTTSEREAFGRWFYASKYAQVALPGADDVQRAWDAWQARAHLAQPAQAVDVGAIRGVIESHVAEAKKLTHDPESQDYLHEQADKLTRAISDGKAGPVDGLSSETFGGWCNTLTHAYMYVTERSWGNAHYGIEAVLNDLREWQRKLTVPAFPAPDKEG